MGSRLLFFVCVKGNGSASFLSNLRWWGLSVHQGWVLEVVRFGEVALAQQIAQIYANKYGATTDV
jgi:hypothetical protein